MAFDEGVAERIREIFMDRHDVEEKKMFGGIAFMMRGHMCVGVVKDTLMARVGPEQYKAALKLPHAREMDFTGKPLKGFIYVAPKGFESDGDLQQWVSRCEQFVTSLPPK
jgi:TfoX/Sxy family transcriptional regulator of competence genes